MAAVYTLPVPLSRNSIISKGRDTLESFLSKVAFESNLRKKLTRIEQRTCSNRESLLRKKKNCENFHDARAKFLSFESHFRERLSKEKLSSVSF